MKRNPQITELIAAIQTTDPHKIQKICEKLKTWLLQKEFKIKITSFQLLVLTEVIGIYAHSSQIIEKTLNSTKEKEDYNEKE